ncbi:trypsin-like peptidase domain-containing protein [Streptomyces sp. NPDC005209]|uniref:S1 family peptidase n=1 Tax=Streptomyces sp. NPDC005209 TaxID=3156715 RepID=UPI0033AF22A7
MSGPDASAGNGRSTVSARVVGWRPIRADDTGDLALLRLNEPPPTAAVPWMVEANELWDHAVRVFGFPPGSDHGVWVAGRLRALQGAGWIQMQSEAGPPIEGGFSGCPVWDTGLTGVVGMAVAAGTGSAQNTAYLLPASLILRAWPELAEHVLPSSPYRGLSSFTEQDAELTSPCVHARTAACRSSLSRVGNCCVSPPLGRRGSSATPFRSRRLSSFSAMTGGSACWETNRREPCGSSTPPAA